MDLISRPNASNERTGFFSKAIKPYRMAPILCFAISTLGVDAAPADAQQKPENSGQSIWTQNVTAYRKESGRLGGYRKRWDLSDLPHYVPKRQVNGTIRFWGNNYLKDGHETNNLANYWRDGFGKFQPGITIDYNLPTAAMAVSPIVSGIADIGMSNKASLMDRLSFEQVYHYPLSEIAVVTGSYDVYGWSPAFIIVVNKKNPLAKISMKQLDGVFGCERTGGYVGSVWHTEYPYSRGPEENIRSWGQLGLTGEWADKPIHIGGLSVRAGAAIAFNDRVLYGSAMWAENYKGYANYVGKGGKLVRWTDQVLENSKDPYAMLYVSPLSLVAEVKQLAIQEYDGGPYVERTLETVRDHTYALSTWQYFYYNRVPGKPVDPKVEEFLRYILSQEGQAEVQREGRYLPLTAAFVKAELKKLE